MGVGVRLAAHVSLAAPAATADLEQMKRAGVIFYAPFDGSHEPAIAGGQAKPFYADRLRYAEGKFGQALHTMPAGKHSASLTYEAPGNFHAEAGALCFWMKPAYRVGDRDILSGSSQIGPMPFGVSSVEQGFYHSLLFIMRRSTHFYFQMTHGDGLETFDYTEAIGAWKANEWHHIAFVWDMERGMKVYDNGALKYASRAGARLVPLTPLRIAFGGCVQNQIRRNPYDTMYDEFLILNRPASDAEIAAIYNGRYDRLQPIAARAPSPFWERVTRAKLHLGRDPRRIAFSPVETQRGLALSHRADLLDIGRVNWKYKHGFMLADGRLDREVFLTEGGLALPQETEFVFKGDSPYNYVVLHGRPMPGSRLRRPDGDIAVSMREGVGAIRSRIPYTQARKARIFFEGDSVLREVMFFRCGAGSMTDRSAGMTFAPVAGPAPVGSYAALRTRLLRYPRAADRRIFEGKSGANWKGEIAIRALSPLHLVARMGLNRFDNPGEPKDRNPLRIAFARIFRFDPDHAVARNLSRWARFGKWPRYDPPQGEPRWAILARELLTGLTRQIHWWVDNRQVDNGYVVGDGNMWNDVTKLYTKYQFLPLISDDRKLVRSMDRYLDAHWDMSGRITDGYSTYQMDILHTAEEATYNTPAMAPIDYGRPKHVERLMETADFLRRKIIRKNRFGRTGFRSNYFSGGNLWLDGRHGDEDPRCQSVTTPLTILEWYNRNPAARKLMLDWGDSILDIARKPVDGEPAGYVHFRANFATNKIAKRYNTYRRYFYMHLLACYGMTGDRKYLEPSAFLIARPHPQSRGKSFFHNLLNNLIWRQYSGEAVHDKLFVAKAKESLRAIAEDRFFQRGLYQYEVPCLLAWLVTRDKNYLVQTMIHDIRNNERGFFVYTEMDPDTDRVYPWGAWALTQMYLGGQALTGRASNPYPTSMISWEKTGTDFAALVLGASPKRLKLLLYGFEDADRNVIIRNWGLAPGAYRVTESLDRDGDDKPDERVRRQTVVLRRMSPVDVILPSRRTHVIEFTQIKTVPLPGLLPDLAVGPEDVEVSLGSPGEGLIGMGPYPPRTTLPGHSIPFVRIRVHNIGSATAGAFRVTVKDGLGKVINEREIADGLPATLFFGRPSKRSEPFGAGASVAT